MEVPSGAGWDVILPALVGVLGGATAKEIGLELVRRYLPKRSSELEESAAAIEKAQADAALADAEVDRDIRISATLQTIFNEQAATMREDIEALRKRAAEQEKRLDDTRRRAAAQEAELAEARRIERELRDRIDALNTRIAAMEAERRGA